MSTTPIAPTLPSLTRLAELLQPYTGDEYIPSSVYPLLLRYLELLIRWNARMNLTAIREPEEMVRRHFGESLFCGLELSRRLQPRATLLDYGSGAGFPGIPIQILFPELQVTLAESQGKKASFLREVLRTLNLPTEVWAQRVEIMPSERCFDAVVLRAVDDMPAALANARARVARSGWLASLSTSEDRAGQEYGGSTGYRDRVALPGYQRSWLNFEPAL